MQYVTASKNVYYCRLSKQSKRGVVAFWDGKSKGTAHSFDLAKEYGNTLKVVFYEKKGDK